MRYFNNNSQGQLGTPFCLMSVSTSVASCGSSLASALKPIGSTLQVSQLSKRFSQPSVQMRQVGLDLDCMTQRGERFLIFLMIEVGEIGFHSVH